MDALRRAYNEDRRLTLLLGVLMAVLYWYLLNHIAAWKYPGGFTLTFNSMLEHMMRGRFDVDPRVVGPEGFVRNGRVYAYWGAWCAFVRLPLWATHRLDKDVTHTSCLAAVWLAGMAKVCTTLFLRRRCLAAGRFASAAVRTAFACVLLVIVLGGSGIAYLKGSVYQEVIYWAAAFGAGFVYCAVTGLVDGFTPARLNGMAVCAGLAVMTRVSTGLGLCVALVLLMIVLRVQRGAGRIGYVQPLAILSVLLVCVGTVNAERWGNPLTFADHRRYITYQTSPERLEMLERYGYFSLKRVPFAVQYYFAPVWEFEKGEHLLEPMQGRLIESTELPPSSLILTDMFSFAFLWLLLKKLRERRVSAGLPLAQAGVIAAGLAIPAALMLTTITLAYRYRMEFYPLLDLLMFAGLYVTVRDEEASGTLRRSRWWLRAATAISITAAFTELLLYKLSDFGPPELLVHGSSVAHFYRDSISRLLLSR